MFRLPTAIKVVWNKITAWLDNTVQLFVCKGSIFVRNHVTLICIVQYIFIAYSIVRAKYTAKDSLLDILALTIQVTGSLCVPAWILPCLNEIRTEERQRIRDSYKIRRGWSYRDHTMCYTSIEIPKRRQPRILESSMIPKYRLWYKYALSLNVMPSEMWDIINNYDINADHILAPSMSNPIDNATPGWIFKFEGTIHGKFLCPTEEVSYIMDAAANSIINCSDKLLSIEEQEKFKELLFKATRSGPVRYALEVENVQQHMGCCCYCEPSTLVWDSTNSGIVFRFTKGSPVYCVEDDRHYPECPKKKNQLESPAN